MGTNFYWIRNDEGQIPGGIPLEGHEERDHFKIHIGKRSAAGLYCWDCGIPLVKPVFRRSGYGMIYVSADAVHDSRNPSTTECPMCYGSVQHPAAVTDRGHPAGVELGFAAPLQSRPSGVSGASSFSWAQEPSRVLSIIARAPDLEIVIDEYGDKYTGLSFSEIVRFSPLWFTDSIGTCFS